MAPTMATFTALNIEPDDHSDDEIDNTKELQIEEALKLYQTALKLHSQGNFPLAASSYINLFKSEIFRYPESITEFARLEQHPEIELTDPSFALDIAAAIDGAPNTLPQILFLSYKNHGQFILDCIKHSLQDEPMLDGQLGYQAKAAIDNFTLAIASDESDAELWRRAARIGLLLGSKRLSRYCLEAAVELDDDPTVAEVDPPALEEAFAGEQLKEQLKALSDETSLSHPIMAPFIRKKMAPFLIKHMDPYPFLPEFAQSLEPIPMGLNVPQVENRKSLRVAFQSWIAIGDALCEAFISPDGLCGVAISLLLPEIAQSIEVEPAPPNQDVSMEDVPVTQSPKSGERAASTSAASKDDEVRIVTTTTTVPLSDGPPQSTSLPTRKRSQSVAGLQGTPEEEGGAQKRSKRIRRRDTTEGPADAASQNGEQLKDFHRADEDVFAFVGSLLNKLGVDDTGTFSDLQETLAKEQAEDRQDAVLNTAVRDLRDLLRTWDDAKASTFMNARAADILGSGSGTANSGLTAFLEHSKSGALKVSTIPPHSESQGLSAFAAKVNSGWLPLQDIIYEWVIAVLRTYRRTIWPEALKQCVDRTISFADAEIFGRIQLEVKSARSRGDSKVLGVLEEANQSLFELHLDIYARVTGSNSIVSHETRTMTKDRVERWADFATTLMRLRNTSSQDAEDIQDDISLRYLWTSVYYATMADDVSREHKVLCWSELQATLQDMTKESIELPNNTVLPEISVSAAEREVSRLTTLDFFFNLFQTDKSDPVAIIETLEPVLDPESACEPTGPRPERSDMPFDATDNTSAALRDMWKFLQTGSTSLRLFLWQRLREAYVSIGYNTKVFSCHLKCIEIIVADLRSEDYVDAAANPRRYKLLSWLKALDDLLVKSLSIALNDAATCFEIVDERHIKTTCAAIAQLNRILHSAALFADEVKVGLIQLPTNPVYASGGSFNSFSNKLREMQVRTWSLQYTLVKEGISQNLNLFPTPEKDLADFLALVHYTLGLRKCCKSSNKIFLKMMKVELIRMKQIDRWEDYLGQVLYDLYGLSLGVGTYLLEDHGCSTENIDRRTVLNIADQVITLANRMPLKDLLKHELRSTIEKMQTAVGPTKASPQMTHNLRNYTEYLKTSIRPINFAKAWKGQLMFDSVPVTTPESPLANQGWYFLLGMISLTKFRSQKRTNSGIPTDDLKVAATFLKLQLQFSADHWETWYRLAQCFDLELEEEILWSTDKINNHKGEIVRLQRSSIHCYVMALSMSAQSADDSFETAEKLSEMYFDFGLRLYSSSREPFSMEAFWVDDFEKHMSGQQGMYKKLLHEEMSRYRTWSHASRLFKEALRDRPNKWMTHYLLGKCLWKMYCKGGDEWDPKIRATKPSMDTVLKTFLRAVEACPKPRDGRQEPIIEPHYKLVSIVHKVVLLGAMPPQIGANLLQQQTYAINKGESVTINTDQEWQAFILSHLRALRVVDKQHWQHRMVARVVNTIYDDNEPDYTQAGAALREYQSSIFTKTMQVVVWKPEAERPGRHCVYMERYVKQMIRLLWLTNDKDNMELLAKRIRKKPMEFFRFNQVWTECCTLYLRLIRRTFDIQATMDETFRSVPPEEFEVLSERLSAWISSPTASPAASHPALDALREASELKKLNANLMKVTPIDDLLNDAYGTLYVQIAKTMERPTQLDDEGASSISRGAGAMSLGNLVMDMNGTQIPVPFTITPIEPRARKIGISRREVLRHAELIVSRGPEPTRAPARPLPEPSMILGSNVGSSNGGEGASHTAKAGEGAGEDEQEESEGEDNPNELADDADDESGSDLSDVPEMEDVDEETIFPGEN